MSWHRRTLPALPCLLLLAACEGDRRGVPTGDTSMNDEFAACESVYEGPVVIDEVRVVCTAEDRLRFFVSTIGWTSDATVFSQATGTAGKQLADEHDVATFKHGACRDWDRLEQKLTTGVKVSAWEPNVSSPLSCSPGDDASHANPAVMTYVVRAYDLDGNLADCMALGHDPEGLLDGTHTGTYTPTHPEELKLCAKGLKGTDSKGEKKKGAQ